MASPTLQVKRGLFVDLPALRAGEPGFTTDKYDLYLGTGAGTTASNQFYGSSRYWKREDGTNAAEFRLVDKDGTNGVSLRAPQSAGAGVTYTLPVTGTQGHYLKLGSAGVLEWASISEGASFSNATLTGVTTISSVDINSGNIDGVAIGATSASTGAFTDLRVTGISTFEGNVSIGNSTSDTLTVDSLATFNQTISGSINGNAGTATSFQTARNISVSGIVTGTASFNGTSDITIATTIQNDVVGLGTHTYGEYVKTVTAGSGLTGDGTGEGSTPTLAVGAGTGITVNANDVALKNADNLSNATVVGWNTTSGQLENTSITYSGTGSGDLTTVAGDLKIGGNEIKSSTGNTAITLNDTSVTIAGDLYVQGSTTQVDTQSLKVEDRTIELGLVGGATTTASTWDLAVLFNYGQGGVAKKAGLVWEGGATDNRFKFTSAINSLGADTDGSDTSTPAIGIVTSNYAPIEIASLWVNNSCAGASAVEVIGCNNSELQLMNIVVDCGTFV